MISLKVCVLWFVRSCVCVCIFSVNQVCNQNACKTKRSGEMPIRRPVPRPNPRSNRGKGSAKPEVVYMFSN
jgi:hypothetical protein